jgi:hypothetical protein
MGQGVQGEEVTQEGQEVSQEGVKEEVVDIKSMSSDELEKKQYEIEKSKDEKDKSLFNKIDKELENREWKSVMNAPLESIKAVLDSLIEKNKTMPNGFSAYIDNTEARKVKSIVDKYSGEVSLNESEKDFKDAFFGNPSSSYSDGLKLRESARAYMDQGGSFKELLKKISNEFVSDGFTEEDAAAVVKRKLDDVKRVNQQATQEGVEQQKAPEAAKPATEQKVQPEISLSGLVNGWTGKSYYAFDPRSNNNVMKFAQDGKSFAEVVDFDGKKYVVVGLALEGDKRAYGAGRGRDRFSFASAELNESTPDNIVDILENSARDNFKSLHKDFNYEEEVIKPITEINTALPTSQTTQAAEEVATEDKSIIDAVETLANAEEAGGSEITKAQKEVAEKLGEEGKKLVEINRNFDKLADDLGFIKTCIIE